MMLRYCADLAASESSERVAALFCDLYVLGPRLSLSVTVSGQQKEGFGDGPFDPDSRSIELCVLAQRGPNLPSVLDVSAAA